MNIRHLAVIILGGLLLPLAVHTHQISTAYLNLEYEADTIQAEYQIRLIDLAVQLKLDNDNNQAITWGEVKNQQAAISTWLQSNLTFSNEAQCSRYSDSTLSIDSHFNEPYLVIYFSLQCGSKIPTELTYQGMIEVNSGHKMLVNFFQNETSVNRILGAENQSMVLSQQANSNWQTFKEYTYQGVIHILIGLDHIMFLLCLLLFAVMTGIKPEKNTNNQSIVWHVLGLVTVFTLAHSVTLVLTAINWLSFPSRWVEIIIALTVAITALNNIKPFIHHVKWVTFAFGLMHGMGFAGVLGELGLPADAKLMPILAFNLGVELGQVLLIILTLPMLIWLARNWRMARLWSKLSSLLILVLAIYWVIERY